MSSPSGNTDSSRFAILLAGGAGTRLWPLSRDSRPKHLARLGTSESLVQITARRIMRLVAPDRIVTVTREPHLAETRSHLSRIDDRLSLSLLTEPVGRNTLPAIAMAVLAIVRKDPDAVVSVFPSDHLISAEESFTEAWEKALEAAKGAHLVTLGIRPTSPETGYGYIQAKDPLPEGHALRAERFVEKPDPEQARQYLKEGNYFWNSGMFVFRADVFLHEMRRHQPDLLKDLESLSRAGSPFSREAYERLPSLSIDYGLMEKSRDIAVVPSSFGWNDLGCWEAVFRTGQKNADGNVENGRVFTEDSHACLLFSDSGVIGAVGLRDLAVVRSGDKVLVTRLSRSQDVKELVEKMKQAGVEESELGLVTSRPWGNYTVLEEGANYKIKRIVVEPGQKLSLQRHEHRAEHWVVIEGTARVTYGDTTRDVYLNESTFIPRGEKHRLENPGKNPLVIIEVQTGSYVGEDDIQRFDDMYGRTS